MTTPPDTEYLDAAARRAAAWADFYAQPDYSAEPEPPTPAGARSAAAQLARLVGEVLAGMRPVQQLGSLLDEPNKAHLVRWLGQQRGARVQLAGARFSPVGVDRESCLLRYLVAGRCLVVLVELVERGEQWRWRALQLALPGPTPTGIMPRWGYDRGRP